MRVRQPQQQQFHHNNMDTEKLDTKAEGFKHFDVLFTKADGKIKLVYPKSLLVRSIALTPDEDLALTPGLMAKLKNLIEFHPE